MARLLRYLFILLCSVISSEVWAQSSGIAGTVRDAKNEPLINATVRVTEGGIVKGGAVTDLDGNYVIKPLNAGTYDVEVSYIGLATSVTEGVQVATDQTPTVNIVLRAPVTAPSGAGGGGSGGSTNLQTVNVVRSRYEKPLINTSAPGNVNTITDKEIEKMAVRNTSQVIATQPGVLRAGRGDDVNISGGRSENTVYIVDGVLQTGSRATNLPPGSVGSISVYTGGLPARYGDATGGVVTITTKGVTSKLQGSIGGEQSVEGYGNSRAYFNVSGPLLRRTDTNGNKRPVLGFTLNGDFLYNHDASPTYFKNYVVKDDVLARLRAEPLRAVPGVTGEPTFRPAAEFVTKSDLVTQKRRLNAEDWSGTMLGKLDYQLADNINVTLGGQFTGGRGRNYDRLSTLFTPENIGTTSNYTARGYLRFTQRFANKPSDRENVISNAFYTVQADYQKEYLSREDQNHGRDIFKYGYVGKFYEDITRVYTTDSAFGKSGIATQAGKGVASNARFERSELNPVLANYTSVLFDKYRIRPTSISTGDQSVRSFNGLLNGDYPRDVYTDVFNNIGNPVAGFVRTNNDQVAVGVDASLDLRPAGSKTRHAIEFGLYYQQRTERLYSLNANISSGGGTNSLWERARLLTNTHFINNLDRNNPIFVVGGQRYTKDDVLAGRVNPAPTDTILFNYLSIDSVQSTFDENLRQKLGLAKNNTDYINVDAVDPNLLSVDMFAPDELFNNGQSFVNYYGYDYAGNLQTGSVNWNDFWTKKDANGKYTRPIGAFRPNYIAGYIQDNFEVSKVRFNVGLRVDRYDANTKVLKDPYSLYETYTVGNNPGAVVRGTDGREVAIPSNIGKDYVVYVANASATKPQIVGFRSGDDWYDPSGRYVEDPTSLKQYTGGTDPVVYQVKNANGRVTDIKDAAYDPNSSFTDYTPQVNVMPRISFSFPIQDQTLFYAHYDVVVQRPRFGVAPSPLDYYFMANQTGQPIINNPNLKPEKLIDYEVGFQQAITKRSAITISAFYKERRDQIQIRPYLYASPQTYYTYGNRDFSTTKGFRVKYDFRRQGPIQFNLSYTLQFAEGTGSSAESSNRGRSDVFQTNGLLQNYIAASLPNIRQTFALNYDARHNIALNLDYRYFQGEGPMIAGHRPFQNAGVNLIATAISGTPYTRYFDPVTTTIIGGVNGARLPWRYQLDLAIDKDIALKNIGRKVADQTGLSGKRAPLVANLFVNFRNLLNTQQILGVYGYSQDPRDNGFLQSAQGAQAIATQTNAASYIDLYSINRDNPGNFNLPRQIYFGFRVNF